MKRYLLFICLIILISCLAGCRDAPTEKKHDKVHVKYSIVNRIEIINKVRAVGRLTSKIESKLSFKTGGVVQDIYSEEGQKVGNGELIASLDLAEINNQVKQAQLTLDKSERDFRRAENLYRDSVVTLEQFQNVRTALDLARTNYEIALFNLEHSRIKAPSRGTILKKLAERNEIVGPGQPVFLFASTEGEWVFRVNITDRDIIRLQENDSAWIQFDAFPGQRYLSVISEKGEIADPYTGTFETELTMIEKPDKMINGLIGTAYIFPSNRRILPVIPHEALLEANGLKGIVYVVENGSTIKKSIHIGSIQDDGLTIVSGIKMGDTLIVEGGNYIRENSQIVLSQK
jgi:RND family efflux transporter MFP subunit